MEGKIIVQRNDKGLILSDIDILFFRIFSECKNKNEVEWIYNRLAERSEYAYKRRKERLDEEEKVKDQYAGCWGF